MPESENHILPRTKQLLEEDIIRRRGEVAEISKQGAGIWEGDQWHSTGYREQQRKLEVAIRFLQLIDQEGGKIEVLLKPTQTDHVEVGHMVKVNLLDDQDIIEAKIPFSIVHVLTKEDVQYLGSLFDNVSEIIVSHESPLGHALIGLRRGECSSYLQKQRLQVLDIEDAIRISNLFDK